MFKPKVNQNRDVVGAVVVGTIVTAGAVVVGAVVVVAKRESRLFRQIQNEIINHRISLQAATREEESASHTLHDASGEGKTCFQFNGTSLVRPD